MASEETKGHRRCRKCRTKIPYVRKDPYCPRCHDPLLSNEHYTPEKYITLARKVMGGIDLDPASNHYANRVVKASKYYTKDQNGLEQQWHGRVWLNLHIPQD